MPATSRVYTLRHAARLLGETEDTVSDAAISMFSEDGAIQVIDDDFGVEDWALASAFTDEAWRTSDTSSTRPSSTARSIICANLEGAYRMHTNDLLDLAYIFKSGVRTPIGDMAFMEFARRDIGL